MATTEQEPSAQAKQNVRNYLKFLKESGFLYLVPTGKKPHFSAHSRAECLEAERQTASRCTKCRLASGRTHVVFGAGNTDAQIMFVGEAPGRDEDLQALPFVGRAGKLLDQMMEQAGLRREDVYITNVNKCRPPGNRDPEPDEIEACRPYLLGQIELIEPRVIVALGRFAAHTLSGCATPITQMRGHFFLYHNVKVMPTLHPAAVMRNMATQYDLVVEDLRRAMHALSER